jgi:hypothetical protein
LVLVVVVLLVPEVVVAVVPEVVVEVVAVIAVPDVSVDVPVGMAEVAVVADVSVVDIVPVVPVIEVSEAMVLVVAEVSLAVAVSVLLAFCSFLQAKPNSAMQTTVRRTRIFLFICFVSSRLSCFVGDCDG